MAATRHPHWQARLDAWIARHEAVPFDWRAHNCATFAAGWVHQATGAQLDVPGPRDAAQAARLLDVLGGLRAEVSRQLGDPVPGAFARVGDVVLARLPAGEGERPRKAMGICLGAHIAAPGQVGLLRLPITEAEAAWRV